MALQLPPELEQRVTARAHAEQREPSALLAELVERALESDDRELARTIAESDAAFERGEGIPHEQAMRELGEFIERRFGPRPE